MPPLTVRRVLGRVVIAAAVALGAMTVARRCEGSAGGGLITVELDVSAVPGVRAAQLELRRGKTVVAYADRNYQHGLGGNLRLQGPALGADGEVRILLETDDGPRRSRDRLTAAGGSVVTIRAGVADQ